MVHGQQRACMPVYIGKSGDLVGCYRSLTHSQTTEYSATQLVLSIKFKLSHAISRQAEQGRVDWNESNKWKCKDLPDIPIRTHLVSANKPFVFCLSSRTPTTRQSAFADYFQIQVKFWRMILFWNQGRNLIFRRAMNQVTNGHLYLCHQAAVIFILGCSLVSCVWQ